MSHPLYWVALQTALGIPSRKLSALLAFFGSPEAVFEASEHELTRCKALTEREIKGILEKPYRKARQIWDDCKENGIWILTPEDVSYPAVLRNIPDMPCVLYGKGQLPSFQTTPAISVVGTRKPTVYGKLVTQRITSVLAAAGMVVVSGGAVGIDSAAHTAALAVEGTTVAVLGCGIANNYLRANRQLRSQIAESGALISEYPPREPASRYTFPIRNRLIAALSLGTIVIEAGEKSGSLITADCALEQGKDVFAVPGSIMSPTFQGSNRIISEGAIPIFSGLDILHYYENDPSCQFHMERAQALQQSYNREMLITHEGSPVSLPEKENVGKFEAARQPSAKKLKVATGKDLSETAFRVYNTILDTDGIGLNDIVEGAKLPVPQVLEELTDLEIDGWIEKDPAGQYRIVNSIEE